MKWNDRLWTCGRRAPHTVLPVLAFSTQTDERTQRWSSRVPCSYPDQIKRRSRLFLWFDGETRSLTENKLLNCFTGWDPGCWTSVQTLWWRHYCTWRIRIQTWSFLFCDTGFKEQTNKLDLDRRWRTFIASWGSPEWRASTSSSDQTWTGRRLCETE